MRRSLLAGVALVACISVPNADHPSGTSDETTTGTGPGSTSAATSLTGDTAAGTSSTTSAGSSTTGSGCDDPTGSECVEPGDVLWSQVFADGPPGESEWAATIAVDDQGELYLGGTVVVDGADVWVAKFASDGRQLWDQEIVAAGDSVLRAITIDATTGVLAAGHADEDGSPSSAWVLPLNAEDGTPGSPATYPMDGVAGWYGLARYDDTTIVAGSEDLMSTGVQQSVLRGYTTGLAELWTEPSIQDPDGAPSTMTAVAVDSLGTYVAGAVGSDADAVGVGGDRASTWTVALSVPDAASYLNDVAIAQPDVEGSRIWFSGTTNQPWDGSIIATDRTGEIVYENLHDLGPHGHGLFLSGLAVDGEGNVVVCGAATVVPSGAPFQWLFFVRKLSPDGTTLWETEFEAPGFFSGLARDVAIGPDGRIYAVGYVADQAWVKRRVVLELAP